MRLLDRNSVVRYLMFNKTEINYFYKLSSQIKYSLEYSTSVEKEIHSMLCLTFSMICLICSGDSSNMLILKT